MAGYNPYSPPEKVDGFQRLTLYGFRQFGLVDLDLSSRLTILTGANGAGKTTLLNILGRHFNWYFNLLASPAGLSLNTGQNVYTQDFHDVSLTSLAADFGFEDRRLRELRLLLKDRFEEPHPQNPIPQARIGELIYRDGGQTSITIPPISTVIQYGIDMKDQKQVDGLYLSSHRVLSSYQQLGYIPAKFAQTEQILEEYIGEIRNNLSIGGYTRTDRSAMLRMKEALLAAAIYGEGNSAMKPDIDARNIWEGFQRVLHLILPESLGFNKLVAEPPEVMLDTKSGKFAIDSISGGMNALFELAWQIHLRSSVSPTFTVVFDEPENHLHPSLQRTLIPGLLAAFPGVNFILATHSPFIATASPDARVYVLRYNDDNFVDSVALDFAKKAKSAEKTLTEVLGMDSTIPVWAEERFDSIISRFVTRPITGESIRALKAELEENGLADELPAAIERYLDMDNPDVDGTA